MDHPTAQCRRCGFDIEASQHQFPGPSQCLLEEYKNRNGYPPLHEAASMKAEMGEAKAQEILLDQIIEHLQSAVTSLQTEKARIKNVMKRYGRILRPIHALPPELLAKIFSFTLNENPGGSESWRSFSSLDPSGMPWVLAQICQSWRHIASTTPNLWRFVTLPGEVIESLNTHSQVHRLCLQIQRSGDHPLDIVASIHNPTISMVPLYSHSHRWRTLHIELRDNESALAMSLIQGRLPLLESLTLSCTKLPINELDCFQFAPRLQTLTLSGDIRGDMRGFPLRLPKDQIIDLSIHDVLNPTQFFLFPHVMSVQNFPNLQTCRFSFNSKSISRFLRLRTQSPDIHVLLGNLRKLKLNHTQGGRGIEAMLSWIKAPSLQTLAILSTGPNRSPFEDFFTQPAALIGLAIERVEMSSSEFFAVLALLTGLRYLKFGVSAGITNDYLEPLLSTTSDDSFSVVPNVQSLSLLPDSYTASPYDDELLANVLETRWEGLPAADVLSSRGPSSNRLLSVRLSRRITSEPVRVRLDQLRGEGMQIKEMEDD